MIEIDVVLDKEGILRSCKAHGHAKAGEHGKDIVCAAVSVLMMAAASALSNRKGIYFNGDAPERGHMWIETGYEAEGKDFLYAAGVYLVEGLKFVAHEYPKNCKLTIKT